MTEITTIDIRDYLDKIQGREITLSALRHEFNILPGSKSFDAVRNIMFQLAEQRVVRPIGRKDGTYKVITQVTPVKVFNDRERRPPFPLVFPKDYDTQTEMSFVENVVIREGDIILISGLSNYGKTTLCLNFCAENIDKNPVLMGNEYTTLIENDRGEAEYVPTPRFLNRLDNMPWIQWVDTKGQDRFTLLPVRDDYAEYVVKNKVNIIDWINISTGEHYLIGTILEDIKRNLGRGLAIIAIQKQEGATAGRGGQFTKDFVDLELLIDKFGESGTLLTIGKVKEGKNKSITGKTYAYQIGVGVKIIDFREVVKCPNCKGKGGLNYKCEKCLSRGYIDADR